MKVIVAGGRDFVSKAGGEVEAEMLMAKGLKEFYDSNDLDKEPTLICGMARGADLMAKQIFEKEGLEVIERPADWKDMSEPCVRRHNDYGEYNAMAGIKRNHAMGDEADILIAFWSGKSKGTKDMIDYMRTLGKPAYIYRY